MDVSLCFVAMLCLEQFMSRCPSDWYKSSKKNIGDLVFRAV